MSLGIHFGLTELKQKKVAKEMKQRVIGPG